MHTCDYFLRLGSWEWNYRVKCVWISICKFFFSKVRTYSVGRILNPSSYGKGVLTEKFYCLPFFISPEMGKPPEQLDPQTYAIVTGKFSGLLAP
jgi:hypothetical protein